MLERGFSKPTERIEKLRQVIIDAVPQVESERAVLITQSYKETEGQPTIIRRAKAVEKIFNELPITIRDNELVVGSITVNPRSTEICPEFSYDWVEKNSIPCITVWLTHLKFLKKCNMNYMMHFYTGMEKQRVL